MTPQRRGEIPDAEAELLDAALAERDRARDDLDTATDALKAAVTAALLAGGSVRVVAEHTGLSRVTVEKWGRAGGWPSQEQRNAWAHDRAVTRDLSERAEAARRLIEYTQEGEDG